MRDPRRCPRVTHRTSPRGNTFESSSPHPRRTACTSAFRPRRTRRRVVRRKVRRQGPDSFDRRDLRPARRTNLDDHIIARAELVLRRDAPNLVVIVDRAIVSYATYTYGARTLSNVADASPTHVQARQASPYHPRRATVAFDAQAGAALFLHAFCAAAAAEAVHCFCCLREV